MQVAIFLIQRNRHALIGRAIDDHDMERVLHFLKNDPVQFIFLFIVSFLLTTNIVLQLTFSSVGCGFSV